MVRGAAPGACSLLTAEMAATLAGGPVGAPADMGRTICGYRPVAGGGGIGLAVEEVQPADEARAIDVLRMTASAGATTEVIQGLGSHSLLIAKSTGKNILIATYRGKVISLGAPGKMTPALKAAMVQAMRQILAKL